MSQTSSKQSQAAQAATVNLAAQVNKLAQRAGQEASKLPPITQRVVDLENTPHGGIVDSLPTDPEELAAFIAQYPHGAVILDKSGVSDGGSSGGSGTGIDLSQVQALLQNYIPKTGSNLNGSLIAKEGLTALLSSSNKSYIRIFGGDTADNGANLDLYGAEESKTPGLFALRARTPDGYNALVGKPDGELSWKNKHIVRSVDEITADINGLLSIATLNGPGYIRLGCDLQLCWGSATAAQGSSTAKATFGAAFVSTSYAILCTYVSSLPGNYYAVDQKTTTYATFERRTNLENACTYQWLAVGRWK